MPNSKRKEFCKTLRNDFLEYGMQTLLLGLTAVITALLPNRSPQQRFIDILANHIIPSNDFFKILNIYILSSIIFFSILTILSTILPIIFNEIIKNIFKRDKFRKNIKQVHIKFGSHLLFKRTGSTIANTGSIMLLLVFFFTLLYYFPHFFNLPDTEIKELHETSGNTLGYYWFIAFIYFSFSIFCKSSSTVFIEEPIKRAKSKSSS